MALAIAVTDLNRADRFYRDVFGAVPVPTEAGTCPWYRLGDLRLTLVPNAAQPAASTFPDHAMASLFVEVDDLADTHRRCLERGGTVLQAPDDLWMLIADPDGVVAEVWQHDPDRTGDGAP